MKSMIRVDHRFVFLLAILGVVFAFVGESKADGIWRVRSEADSATERSQSCNNVLDPGTTCYHTYTNADTNSEVITTRSLSDICLDPDILTEGAATATIRVRRALTSSKAEGTFTWSVVLNQILNGDFTATPPLDCIYDLPRGVYYVESVVPPGAQEVVVSLTSH